jgi:hypothetical protein
VWNKGLSGKYPYVSPNKGKPSNLKTPRSEATKKLFLYLLENLIGTVMVTMKNIKHENIICI